MASRKLTLELVAVPDWEKALAFYGELFGWHKADAHVGSMGTYQQFSAGGETIGGRSAVAFHAASTTDHELVGWIDAALRFPLRIKTQDGAVIMAENIRDEPQPVQLFEMASGFRKFDPQALINQIKQSDVWVAGQKGPKD